VHGKPLVYLDSAASAQKPQQVLDALLSAYQDTYANVIAGCISCPRPRPISMSRCAARWLISSVPSPETRLCLTAGATMSLNLIARSWAEPRLQPGDEILISIAEHHANIVPWQMVAEKTGRKGARLHSGDDGAFSMDRLRAEISDRTRIIAVPHVSNVLGTVSSRLPTLPAWREISAR
jgi:cysteine desulfurase/selenocysteine lyase